MEEKKWLNPKFREMSKPKKIFVIILAIVLMLTMFTIISFLLYGALKENWNIVWICMFCTFFFAICISCFFAFTLYKKNKKLLSAAIAFTVIALIALVSQIVFWCYKIRLGFYISWPFHGISLFIISIMLLKAKLPKENQQNDSSTIK